LVLDTVTPKGETADPLALAPAAESGSKAERDRIDVTQYAALWPTNRSLPLQVSLQMSL